MFKYKNHIGLCLLVIHLFFSQLALAGTKEYRLPKSTIPISQYIEMHLDPDKEEYSGITMIDIKVAQPTSRIGIHWLDLEVKSLPEMYQSFLPLVMEPNCQAENIQILESFYASKGDVYQASLNKSLEAGNNCLIMKKREANSFAQFLSKY
jgi:hypothetical protein